MFITKLCIDKKKQSASMTKIVKAKKNIIVSAFSVLLPELPISILKNPRITANARVVDSNPKE